MEHDEREESSLVGWPAAADRCHSDTGLRRRAVLFSVGGVFRCRGCHDLAYESTREDDIDRGTRRIRTLQRKLDEPTGCAPWHVPEKPAGMHWRTYKRLVRDLCIANARRVHVHASLPPSPAAWLYCAVLERRRTRRRSVTDRAAGG